MNLKYNTQLVSYKYLNFFSKHTNIMNSHGERLESTGDSTTGMSRKCIRSNKIFIMWINNWRRMTYAIFYSDMVRTWKRSFICRFLLGISFRNKWVKCKWGFVSSCIVFPDCIRYLGGDGKLIVDWKRWKAEVFLKTPNIWGKIADWRLSLAIDMAQIVIKSQYSETTAVTGKTISEFVWERLDEYPHWKDVDAIVSLITS